MAPPLEINIAAQRDAGGAGADLQDVARQIQASSLELPKAQEDAEW